MTWRCCVVCAQCLKVEHAPTEREVRTFHVELQYPQRPPPPGEAWPRFATILERSLARQEDIRAWCPTCKAYQPLQQVTPPTRPQGHRPCRGSRRAEERGARSDGQESYRPVTASATDSDSPTHAGRRVRLALPAARCRFL